MEKSKVLGLGWAATEVSLKNPVSEKAERHFRSPHGEAPTVKSVSQDFVRNGQMYIQSTEMPEFQMTLKKLTGYR